MTAQQLVMEGLVLMLIGMGTVFAFLTLLVWAMRCMSALLGRLPATQPVMDAPAPPAPPPDAVLQAVIAAALHQHRQRRGNAAATDQQRK